MEDFINSLPVKKEDTYKNALHRLWDGVASTNKLIGLDPAKMSEQEIKDTLKQYEALCYEEGYVEGKEAIEKKDRVLLLDSLIDLFVVGFFHIQLRGYTFEDVWGYIIIEPDEVLNIVDTYSCRQESSRNNNISLSVDYNSAILNYLSVDVDKAVTEVLRSNLSKIPSYSQLRKFSTLSKVFSYSDEAYIQNEIDEIEEKGRYSGVYVEEVVDNNNEIRLVFWCTHEYGKPKKKYIKPCTFVDADFASCWID